MQDHNNEKGFTLIELMIVITIIGVLAAVAVPVYQDYTIRTRVAECTSLFGPIKTATTLFVSDQGGLPTALGSLSGISPTAADHNGEYVLEMDFDTNGNIECTLRTLGSLGDASGDTVVFAPAHTAGQGRVLWSVDTTSTVPDEYLPSL